MRLEARPRILFQQPLTYPQLRRTGSVHSLFPSRPVVDGRDAGITFDAHVPDPGGAVRMASRPAKQVPPEHVTLHVLERGLHVAFIAVLADYHRHRRFAGTGSLDFGDRPAPHPSRRVRSGACRN